MFKGSTSFRRCKAQHALHRRGEKVIEARLTIPAPNEPSGQLGKGGHPQRSEVSQAASARASASVIAIFGIWAVGFWVAGSLSHWSRYASLCLEPTRERSEAIGVPTFPTVWQP